MDLINTITKKKEWKTKFVNPEISDKWKNEFLAQGADPKIVEKVFQLLKLSLEEKIYESYDADFPWILDITTNPRMIGLQCNGCECKNCHETPYYSDWEDEMDSDSGEKEEYRKVLETKCSCHAVLNLDKIKQDYLEKFIVTDHKLIDSNLRKDFIKAVKKFTKGKEKDYHPGTSETVIDTIHPSLYCYVDGITQIKGDDNLEKPSLFQWIPANYSLKDNKFTSPINGCDQDEYPDLYNCIEMIFSKFLNGFQNVFSNLYKNHRMDNQISLNDYDDLQVIVKIGSTELTSLKNKSTGTNFHLEGIREEQILATGIYYYDMQNVTDSYLSFRTVTSWDIDYPQNHTDYVEAHYGLTDIDGSDDTESVIPLGKIHTKKNMCLVFPNFLQHRVDEFELVDKTKDGHRDILVFFLIDPRKKIISTANIVNNEMSLEEAKIYRELLMFQRKFEIRDQSSFFERGWSLCEH